MQKKIIFIAIKGLIWLIDMIFFIILGLLVLL